jgi:hypothetical protein
MNVTRNFAVVATFIAGVAVGSASTAWADQTMSGHYIKTETDPTGQNPITDDWYFTPCGDGCAQASFPDGTDQAQLVNGQWVMDLELNSICRDDQRSSGVESHHYTWDPNTLAGTNQVTIKSTACGSPPGAVFIYDIQFTPAAGTLTNTPGEVPAA